MRPPIARGILGGVLAIMIAGPARAIVDVATTDNDAEVDYNSNGCVDAADYTVWRDHLGDTGTAGEVIGDGTGDDLLGMSDGDVDSYDYDYWKQHYGEVVPTWWNGDSGWESVTSGGGINYANYTYLGNSWVLATGSYSGLPAHFTTGSFDPIPNQDFLVPSPAGWPGLTPQSDLRLIRINGDPGMPAVTLAAQPPPLGGEVVFIGQGLGRAAEQTHWKVAKYSNTDWAWTPVPSGGDYSGYKAASAEEDPVAKRWGTNTIADEDPIFDESDTDLDHVLTRNGRSIVSLVTTFDQLAPGDPSHESQTISGDTGSAVFYNRGTAEAPQWELAGLAVSAAPDPLYKMLYPGQSANWAVFGNVTALADLSVYRDGILSIMNSHHEYSVMGDINLDGVVWDGTGDPANDPDIAAFLDGWMAYDYGTGSIASWQRGDLNLDGKTDVADFMLLRGALGQPASGFLVAAMDARTAAAPEPCSAALVQLGAALAAGRLRRRRSDR
jgi:hypothetical protein